MYIYVILLRIFQFFWFCVIEFLKNQSISTLIIILLLLYLPCMVLILLVCLYFLLHYNYFLKVQLNHVEMQQLYCLVLQHNNCHFLLLLLFLIFLLVHHLVVNMIQLQNIFFVLDSMLLYHMILLFNQLNLHCNIQLFLLVYLNF